MAEEKMIMTKAGMEKLEKEYRHLIDVEKPEVVEALKAARAQGDLSENADYDAARTRQAEIEARIQEIEHIRDVAEIVSDDMARGSKKAALGTLVTYKKGDREISVKLAGTVEADPLANPPLISSESAIGKAIFGKSVGETCMVETAKPYEITIIKIVSGF